MEEILVPYLDGEASPDERRRVEEHVARCPACARDLEVHGQIGDVLTAVCAPGRLEPCAAGAATLSSEALADRVRATVNSAARRERRVRALWVSSAAALLLACGLALWRPAPWRGAGPAPIQGSVAFGEPGEELLGALDVLEALDKEGMEPTPEVAQVLLEALDSSYPDLIDVLLPEDVSPEQM